MRNTLQGKYSRPTVNKTKSIVRMHLGKCFSRDHWFKWKWIPNPFISCKIGGNNMHQTHYMLQGTSSTYPFNSQHNTMPTASSTIDMQRKNNLLHDKF